LARSKNGQSIPPSRLTPEELASLEQLRDEARSSDDLAMWLRAQAVLAYVAKKRVVDVADQLDVGESSVRNWILWYAREGAHGLRSAKRGRSTPKLNPEQLAELAAVLDAGPLAAGFSAGMWTGKMVASLIKSKFNVSFHPQSVPRLLHKMGFSVQRPRKRLARADPIAQTVWKEERLPALKKKQRNVEG
jgi:transposase